MSLQSKRRLAEGYLKLVETLDGDVRQLIKEGLATKADELSVRVKVNEAKVSLIQVNNGLSISRMLLCQLCGLDLNTPVKLEDEDTDVKKSQPQPLRADVETAFANRPELGVLALSEKIYGEKVRLARAEFLPTVALTGGYLASRVSSFAFQF